MTKDTPIPPKRYEVEIALRETRLSELDAAIATAGDRERDTLADVIVGAATEADVKNIQAELQGHHEGRRITTLEIEGLRTRLSESLAKSEADEQQRVLENVVAPAAAESAAAWRAFEEGLKATMALGVVAMRGHQTARQAWRYSRPAQRDSAPASIGAPAGGHHFISELHREVAAHLWAAMCIEAPELLSYRSGAPVHPLFTAAEYMSQFKSMPERFGLPWASLLETVAGRPDLAALVRAQVETAPPAASKSTSRAKVAA
jgi:hypothetical protein